MELKRAHNSLQTILISRFLLNLRRTQLTPSVPTRPSGIRSSAFHIPTIPDIVEDMGRPLDHGLRDYDADAEVEAELDTVPQVAGPSFIQGSSCSADGNLQHQTGGRYTDAVRCHAYWICSQSHTLSA